MVVVWCLLATSAIMLSEKKKRKRKMCSKKWYLERNISCDVHLLNELLETDVPWDDAIVVWAGKLRKLWDSLSELRSSLCVKDDWKGQSESWVISFPNYAVYSVFPSGKIAQFIIGGFRDTDIRLLMQCKQLLRTACVVTVYFRLLHSALHSGVHKQKLVPLAAERLT